MHHFVLKNSFLAVANVGSQVGHGLGTRHLGLVLGQAVVVHENGVDVRAKGLMVGRGQVGRA